MLLSAVSLGFVLTGNSQGLPKKDSLLWEQTKRSVALLLRGGIPNGEAALIDKSGLFLANQSAVSTPTVQARLSDGRIIVLDWKGTDVVTQTVLLQAENWTADAADVVTLHPSGESVSKATVLVVLPSGPVLGELISNNRTGVVGSSKRVFQLGEVRFESNTDLAAGALVFDEDAHLIGLLNATLDASTPEGEHMVRVRGPKSGNPLPIGAGGGSMQNQAFANRAEGAQFGPAFPTTGYTVGPEILRRVVAGFLSPTHTVMHPAIGVTCKDGLSPGALVLTVKPGSPAEKAGIQPGDLIVRMDETPIKTQIDFAKMIETKDVGDPLTVVVMRDLEPHTLKLTVGTVQKVVVSPSTAKNGGDF